MRLAYADPPYPGRAHLYADHPDYAGEVNHPRLIASLNANYDGWALSTSAEALRDLLPLCPKRARVLAWVKHTITVSWEPLIVISARTTEGVRDWIQVEPESYREAFVFQPSLPLLGRSAAAEKRADRRARAMATDETLHLADCVLPGGHDGDCGNAA